MKRPSTSPVYVFIGLFALLANNTTLCAQNLDTLSADNIREFLYQVKPQQEYLLTDLEKGRYYSVQFTSYEEEINCFPSFNNANLQTRITEEETTYRTYRFQAQAETEIIQLEVPCSNLSNLKDYLFTILCDDCLPSPKQRNQAGITIEPNVAEETLIRDVFLGGNCFAVENISYSGTDAQKGVFRNGLSSVNAEEGVILSTGNVRDAVGPNNEANTSGKFTSVKGDSDLRSLLPPGSAAIKDVVILEFDFTPTIDNISFEYIFASEEYCEYVDSRFNDVFGFFISGPGITGSKNIAKIPGTSTNVAINSVNFKATKQYYNTNVPGWSALSGGCSLGEIFTRAKFKDDIEFDGFTTVLTAESEVIPCETYHIKLVIGDVGDNAFDSAVFLKANSFQAGGTATANVNVPDAVDPNAGIAFEGCQDAAFIFKRTDDDLSENLIIEFTISDESTATMGEDYLPFDKSVVIPRGESFVELPITTIPDMLDEPSESIILELENACTCDSSMVEFTIVEPEPIVAFMEDVTTCEGGTVRLMPEIEGGLRPFIYEWETGDITALLTQEINAPATYTVTITDKCGASSVAEVDVKIEEQVAEITGDTKICNGDRQGDIAFNLTGTGPWDVTYSRNGIEQPIIRGIEEQPFLLLDSIEGTYEIIEMKAGGCEAVSGVGSADLVNSQVTMDFQPNNPKCFNTEDGVVSLTTSGANLQYEWNTGDTDRNLRNVGIGTYIVTVTDPKGCLYVGDSIVLQAPEAITAEIAEDGAINCYTPTGVSLKVEANGGTPGYLYAWDGLDETSDNLTDIGAGDYKVAITDANNCILEKVITVVADTIKPVALARGKNNLSCKVLETNLSGAGSSEGEDMSYQWLTSDGNFVADNETLDPLIDAPGDYQLVVTNRANGCQSMTNIVVGADYEKPSIDIAAPASLNCQVETLSLQGTVLTPSANYTANWTSEDGNIVSGEDDLSPTLDRSGTYSFTVVNEENGCEETVSTLVLQDTVAPLITMMTNPNLTCERQTLTLLTEVDLQEGAYTHSWNAENPTNIIANRNTLNPVVNATGVYALTVQNKNNFCITTKAARVGIDTIAPQIDLGASFVFTCDKEFDTINALLDGSSDANGGRAPGAFVYEWTTDNGAIEQGSRSLQPVVSKSGNYRLLAQDRNNGCETLANILITEDTNRPKAVIEPPAKLNCVNAFIRLDAANSTTGSSINYTWKTIDGQMLDIQDPLRPEIDEIGNYILEVFNTENNCMGSTEVEVELDTIAPVARIAAPDPLSCTNEMVRLDGTGSSKGEDFIYAWNTSDGNIVNGNTSLFPNIDKPGTYTVDITSKINGCSTQESLAVTENVPQAMRVESIDPPCPEDDGMIEFTNIEGGVGPYRYSINGGQQYSTNTQFARLNPGTYSLSVMDANGCELGGESINIAAARVIDIDLAAEMQIELGDSIELHTNTNVPEEEIAEVFWSPPLGLSCTDCPQPIAKPLRSESYQVEIMDQNGCSATASISFLVDADPQVFVPTAFSPNNADGINDKFTVFAKSSSVRQIKTLQVYNRWGELVFQRDSFEPNDESKGWNGRFNDQELSPQVFLYFAEIIMLDGREVMIKGDVALME